MWAVHEAQRVALGGFANRPGATALEPSGETVHAYVSDSRWVADCPACNGGIACWSAMPDGCCYDCGRVYQVAFPPSRDLGAAVAVLEKRPENARHWRPWEQDVADLKAENVVRGVLP